VHIVGAEKKKKKEVKYVCKRKDTYTDLAKQTRNPHCYYNDDKLLYNYKKRKKEEKRSSKYQLVV